ncbi:MAG TPA: class E sortase [Candidatus Dormibacteraeota bacterium]|nr:class E sortase [Candidatus Dormibacteraeota bacterium]
MGVILAGSGILLIVAGLAIFVPPLVGVLQRARTDTQALQKWKDPGSALSTQLPKVKTIQQPGTSPVPTAPNCGSGSPASEYALIDFPSLSGIEGVAGNGNWSQLLQRSVVHYSTTPGPGQPGNGLYALHREPNFEPLGTLKAGDTIVLTNRTCQQFTYVITQVWTESPSQVTQLQPISSGTWITVVTCTPLWIDSHRLVIRAQLQTS